MNKFSQISIIIPTKDRLKVLKQTIESVIEASKQIEVEIIIVNDSNIGLDLGETNAFVKVFQNRAKGVASARNFGALKAKYDLLLFIDDDIILKEDTLLILLDFLNKYPKSSVNFNWIYPPETNHIIEKTKFGRYLNRNGFSSLKGWIGGGSFVENSIIPVSNLAAFFLPIRKEIYEKINGFDESFPYAGAEDYDFSERLKNEGITMYLNTTHTVYHNECDRLILKPWLQRKKRNGATKRVAVNLGYDNFKLNIFGLKKLIYICIYFNRNLIIAFLKIIPNHKKFDFIYGYVVNRMLAAYQFNGYSTYIA